MSIPIKLLAATFTALLATGGARAQVAELHTADPVGDSIAIAKMQYRMERIRRERPTVALVLSGGGAKGAAHVGAIRFLEKVGIPVDMVLGTSMGGLVGGLYSIGYSPAQMDSLLKSLDWSVMLSDRIPPQYRSYQQRKYKDQYIFSVPFFYSPNAILNSDSKRRQEEEDRTLHLGANDEFSDKSLKDNLFGSLPSGYIHGHNVNKLISSLTVGYQDDTDFCDLPLPFFCIAADLVTGKPKLWHSGKLNSALRSTMSIPGIFAPVREDGMILVDGGMINNYPTDVAKAMGADIVIGVELSDAEMTYSDINNLGDMVWKMIDIMGMDSFTHNVSIPDVTIKPDLREYNMMSFDPVSIEAIIERGYEAAYNKADELFALKDRVGRAVFSLQSKPAIDAGTEKIRISDVTFEGLSPADIRYLSPKIGIQAGDVVTKEEIESVLASLYGTQSFDYVSYELLGSDEPFVLNLKCKKGPVHQVGFGARLDSESLVSLLLNVGFNVHKVQGSSWDITAKAAANPYLNVHYMYKTPNFPTVNFEAKEAFTDANLIDSERTRYNFKFWNIRQQLYISDLNWKTASIRAGIRNEYFNVRSLLSGANLPASYDKNNLKDDLISAFFDAKRDTFDDGYFPTKGYKGGLTYNYIFHGHKDDFTPVHAVQFDAMGVIQATQSFHIIPSVNIRMLFGDTVPVSYLNYAGGSMAGRYYEQQVPFTGINNATPLANKMVVAGTNFRIRMTKNNYLSAVFNLMKSSDTISKELLWAGDTFVGTGLEYAYDSLIGPLKFDLHWSNYTKTFGAYISLGFDF